MIFRKCFVPLACVGLLMMGSVAGAAPITWTEVGDAGSFPGSAQMTIGHDVLNNIVGTVGSGNDADMYGIFITNPAAFSATTAGRPGTLNDTQLFLFNSAGFGVYANDDSGTVRSTLPAGNPNSPTTPGLYYLVISTFDQDPTSPGGLIFPSTPFSGVFGPTGPGGGQAISGYNGAGGNTSGTYDILLTGASTSDVPEPASLVLMASGLAGVIRARRRAQKRA